MNPKAIAERRQRMSKFGPMKVVSKEGGKIVLESADEVERGEVTITADDHFINVHYCYDYIDEDEHIRNSDDVWRIQRDPMELNTFLNSRFGVTLDQPLFGLIVTPPDWQCPVCAKEFLDKWEEPVSDGLIVGYVHAYDTTYHIDDKSYGCFSFHPVVRS
jgi:hypothetical protein